MRMTGNHYDAQVGLELMILLPQPLSGWDHKPMPSDTFHSRHCSIHSDKTIARLSNVGLLMLYRGKGKETGKGKKENVLFIDLPYPYNTHTHTHTKIPNILQNEGSTTHLIIFHPEFWKIPEIWNLRKED